MQVVAPLLVMLVKETQTDTTSARPVILALVNECRDRLDIMAAQNEAAFVAAVHALHADIGTFVPAGTQQATVGSQPQQCERDVENGAPCVSDSSQRQQAAEAELCAEQAVCSQRHATRFLFATLALALSDAGSTEFCSTVCKQLRLALRRGVSPAIGEALGEILFAVCSAASSDLSRACRRIFVQAATRRVGLCAVLRPALDRSEGGFTPIPYSLEPTEQCEPGLLFAVRVDIADMQSTAEETNAAVEQPVGGCGQATIVMEETLHEDGIEFYTFTFSWGLSIRLEELPSGGQLPAVVCLVPEEEADAFLAAPVTEWEALSEGLQDGAVDQKAWVLETSVVDEDVAIFTDVQHAHFKAGSAYVLLLHAQRA